MTSSGGASSGELLGVEGVHRGWWLPGQLVVGYQVSNHLGETGSQL